MSTPDLVARLLLILAGVIIAGRLIGWLFRRLGQPPVIGEIIAGILLGPSLLGVLAPEAQAFLLPSEVVPVLGVVAQAGVVLYMFIVGLELSLAPLQGQMLSTIVTAQAGIALPMILGAALAVHLAPLVSTASVPFPHFALFCGVALSITAFPVLARILADLGMSRTELGVRALAAAAIADLIAWCLLAFVVGIVQASPGHAVRVTLLAAAVLVVFAASRPIVANLVRRSGESGPSHGAIFLTLAVLLVSAWVTHTIGVHAVVGAFLVGAAIPHDSRLALVLRGGLERPVTVLLLPAFFAYTGMRTEIGLVSGWSGWVLCVLIVVVATVGKLGGTVLAARLTGLAWRPAAALGVLMNTRGLMELVVLDIGLQLGVISATLFSMMVIMAMVTTMATTPVLRLILPAPRPATGRRL